MWSNKSNLILHGEDDAVDIVLMKRMLAGFEFECEYENLKKGNEVLDRLLRTGAFADSDLPRPSLVLLDIGLPVLSGTEILQTLRRNEETCGTPIIIFSGSSALRDMHSCIGMGANGYVRKSADTKTMSAICEGLFGTWLSMMDQHFC